MIEQRRLERLARQRLQKLDDDYRKQQSPLPDVNDRNRQHRGMRVGEQVYRMAGDEPQRIDRITVGLQWGLRWGITRLRWRLR